MLSGVAPVTVLGTAHALAKSGKAAVDVELDALWSADQVEDELKKLLPAFFWYLSGLKPRTDGQPHWALCYYHKRVLKVWEGAMRPAGSDLFQCKSTRSGRPSSESWIHIGE